MTMLTVPYGIICTLAAVCLCVGAHITAANTDDKTDGKCNPVVELLFVLDNSSYVNQSDFLAQKAFIRDIMSSHQAPKGAVRVSSIVCSDNTARSTPFTETPSTLLENLNVMQSSPITGSSDMHCLESISLKFKSESREGVFRIAVLVRAGGEWDNTYTKHQAEILRENRIASVVVTVGIKNFGKLSALQLLASEEGTFFVLSKFSDLKNLATNLSQGSCKPITLNLVSESSFDVQKLNKKQKSHPPCLRIDNRTFKRYIPGLGYIRDSCRNTQTLNVTTCSCT